MIEDLKELLQQDGCTLVVENDGDIRTFSDRGIAALYRLFTEEPEFLKGASVADKVVGKGAAALMVAGGVEALYAELISEAALALLATAPGIRVEQGTVVSQIYNRSHTGLCPVEQLCLHARTTEACLPLIKNFMNKKQ